MNDEFRHPIRVVSLRTGLSAHVIRAWERRYGAVIPQRSGTNRRLYSDAEIRRFQQLRKATLAGHSIGRIARLSNEDLEALLAEDQIHIPKSPETLARTGGEGTARASFEACVDAVRALDAKRLEELLLRALVRFSQPVVLGEILLPLMGHIGDCWQQGSLKIVHEHLASVVVRNTLAGLATPRGDNPSGPAIVVVTPAGQAHEFGALAAAATAASMGWRVMYLGSSLPAEEIAAGVEVSGARAVALSVVYPADDPRLIQEIHKLRRMAGDSVAIIVGGRAAENYREGIEASGGILVRDLSELGSHLETLQRTSGT